MLLAEGMQNIVKDIVSSYETRIKYIESILDTTHQLLEGFQDSLLDTRKEREKLNAELRENLAKNESLRRKDFDNMMKDIFLTQDEREKKTRDLLSSYLNEQKEMTHTLKDNLVKVTDGLAKGEAGRVKEFQEMMKEILAKQDERKEEVTFKLKEFQKAQQEMTKKLEELLAKGRELRIKDIKLMLKEFKVQHKERITRQEERREEVKNLLGDFNKERVGAAENWRIAQKEMAQRRTGSSKVI